MRLTKKLLPFVGAAGASLLLGACSNQPVVPQPGEYAFVVGGGSSSNQNLHYIVGPGVHIKVSNGDRVLYVPASTRDFITAKPGSKGADRTNPNPSYTAGQNGLKPVQVLTYDHVVFELNPNKAAQRKFYDNLCTKYGCGSLTSDTANANNTLKLNSPPGWLAMVLDKYSTAVDNAVRAASATYGPDLWHNTAAWNAYGNKIATFLPKELRLATGGGTDNYFCGVGSTSSHCAPFTVLVNDVVPTDGAIATQYSQANEADLQGQSAASRAAAAKTLYGSEGPYWLGVKDAINACKGGSNPCTIVIGQPSGTGVPGK